jgi:HK97 family phage major capsid protein
MFIAKTLRADRFKLITDAQALISKPDAGPEAFEKFDAMMAEADAQMEHITRVEKADAAVAATNEILGESAERSHVSLDQKYDQVNGFKAAFLAYMKLKAEVPLTSKDKTALENYQAAASVGTGSAGGYTVPTDLMRTIYTALALEGGVRAVARILTTSSGNNLDIPMNDDTSNVATLVAEGASQGTAPDLAFSKATLSAYKYTSGIATVSRELLQDSAFSFDEFLEQQMVHRFARGTNLAYSLGTGSAQPQGYISAVSGGVTGATGEATSIKYTSLVNLEHSVAVPYRRNAKWLMSDAAFKSIKALVDGQNRPLWLPNITVGAPDSILGYPVEINADAPAPGANVKGSVCFGDFSNFFVRDVLDLNFQVLQELYAASGQIGIVGIMRTDSRLVSLGACIKAFTNSAT